MARLLSIQAAVNWLRNQGAAHLQADSRLVQAGDAFIAWPGAATDGRKFVKAALEAGAVAALIEDQGASAFDLHDPRVATYAGLKAACGPIAAEFFAQPSQDMQVIAITGTNGKTSSAWWLAQCLSAWVQSTGGLAAQGAARLVGTLGLGVPGHMTETGLTTPDPMRLQATLAQWRDEGARYCAIEASSIGIAERRMDGLHIHTAVFTNFTQDHLDYHGSMDAYWLAKRSLFDWPGLRCAVVNLDDPKGQQLLAYCQQRGLQLITTSMQDKSANLYAYDVRYSIQGMQFFICEGKKRVQMIAPVVGHYNVANLLGVVGALRSLGLSLEQSAATISHCTPVPGRMELISQAGAPLIVIDYAHTPDALTKVLEALRPLAQSRTGQLWCIFGCGGNRDTGKRPLMAHAAESADHIVVTNDNPRDEAPEVIAKQIMAGFTASRSVRLQLHRLLAVKETITQAKAEDVILLAGKGHEAYQEIAGTKHAYSDVAAVRQVLKELSA
jgi:UDP-N-acetylmuramyl-tripeptide synthetase